MRIANAAAAKLIREELWESQREAREAQEIADQITREKNAAEAAVREVEEKRLKSVRDKEDERLKEVVERETIRKRKEESGKKRDKEKRNAEVRSTCLSHVSSFSVSLSILSYFGRCKHKSTPNVRQTLNANSNSSPRELGIEKKSIPPCLLLSRFPSHQAPRPMHPMERRMEKGN